MRWPKGGRPAVSVAGGSAARIRLPAGGQHDLFRFDRSLGRSQLEALVQHAASTRRSSRQRTPGPNGGVSSTSGSAIASVQPARSTRRSSASRTSAARSLAGNTFPPGSTLVGTPSASNRLNDLLRSKGGQGGMEESAVGAKRLDDSPCVGGVGQIAAGAAGKEDFHARLAVFVQQDRLASPFRRPRSRHQPRRSAADDRHVPMRHVSPSARSSQSSAV